MSERSVPSTSVATEGQAPDDRRAALASLERHATAERAMAFFDSLPAVQVGEMLGSWRGSALPTGHPFDGMLELFGWHGKRFEGPEEVHPLVMGEPGALFSIDPAAVPMGFARRYARHLKSRGVAAVAKPLMRLIATRRPKARLRMTEFRGVVSATMVYDALPVNDVFRRVDDDTVLGVMDLRGDAAPGLFFFVLRRER